MWPFRMPPRQRDPREWITVEFADDRLHESIARLESEPTSCPCECHRPAHEARKPHPLTMAGK